MSGNSPFQQFTLTTVTVMFAMSFAFSQQPRDSTEKNEPEPAKKAIPGELPVKIEFIARFAQNYTLTFVGKPDAERFQITREQTANYARQTMILKIGETSEDGKFRLEGYEEREGRKTPLGISIGTSELSVTWLETGQKVTMTQRVPETIPTYFAKLSFPASKNQPAFEDYFKEETEFEVPSLPNQKLKLASADEESVTIEFEDAEGQLRKAEIAKSQKSP